MEGKNPYLAYRERQQLSQADLARLLGFSRSYVRRLETGERQIGPDRLTDVSAKLGVSAKILRPDLAELMNEAD